MTLYVRGALIVVCAAGVASCRHVQPKTVTLAAALEMPAPPGRLLIPVELPEPEPEPPATADLPAPAPTPARPRETAVRPAERPAPAATPAAEPTPPPVLQTTTQVGPLVEQKVNALLASAELNLGKLNFRELSSGARAQYDQARSFIRMSNEALRAKNYMYAELLATKANDLGRLLVRD